MEEPRMLLRSGEAQRPICWQCMQPHWWHARLLRLGQALRSARACSRNGGMNGKRTAAKADLEHLVALAHALPCLDVGQGVPARWPQAFNAGLSYDGIAACLQLGPSSSHGQMEAEG